MPRHELQVVDDDQAEALPAFQAARLSSYLHHRQVRVVVYEQGGLPQLADGVDHFRPVRLVQLPVPHAEASTRASEQSNR